MGKKGKWLRIILLVTFLILIGIGVEIMETTHRIRREVIQMRNNQAQQDNGHPRHHHHGHHHPHDHRHLEQQNQILKEEIY